MSTFAQRDKQLTNYMFDRMSFNPGATGLKGLNTTTIGRLQWVNVDNAPRTLLFNLQGNLPKIKSGLGLSFYVDQIGFGTHHDLKLNFSHQFSLGKVGTLSPGIGVGILRYKFIPTWFPFDSDLPVGFRDTGFDINLGLFLKGSSLPYYFGFSTTHITQPFLDEVNFKVARHYYFTGGYDITYKALPLLKGLSLKPSFLVITEGVTTSFDLTLMANYVLNAYNDELYLGITYRRKDAIAILVGYHLKRSQSVRQIRTWHIGYAYDITTSSINNYSKGSHEVVLRFNLFKSK